MKGLEPLRLSTHDPKLILAIYHPYNRLNECLKTGKLYPFPHSKGVKFYHMLNSYNVFTHPKNPLFENRIMVATND